MKYVYSFTTWPDETWEHPQSLFLLFGLFSMRAEMEFSEADFEWFRSELSHVGLTLREIERWPMPTSEVVA